MAVKFCPNCGNKVDGSSNFCPKCGYDLAEFKNKQSKEKHEFQEGDHIPYHRDDPTNNPIVEEENPQIKSDPDYKAYKALGDSSMSFAEYKRNKKKLQKMEPIPKHEKKEGMLTSDLYQSLVAHPEQINQLCEDITKFDKAILFKEYLGELTDINHSSRNRIELGKLFRKTIELEDRLHILNEHIEGNTMLHIGIDAYHHKWFQ